MSEEILADRLLRWLGRNPAAYPQIDDKWPVIFSEVFSRILPFLFGILILLPFFWLWHKKKKWTLKNIGLAILQSIGLAVVGVVFYFLLLSFALGQIFQAINS